MGELDRNLILAGIIALVVFALLGATIAVLAREVARLRRAEGPLRESEEKWRAAFAASNLGMARTDRDLKFVATNPAFQAMLGYTDAELRGLTPFHITADEDLPTTDKLRRAFQEGKQQSHDVVKRYRRKDGTLIWVQVYMTAVPGDDGKPRFFLATVIDITARKLAEDAMRVAQSELARVARLTTVGEMTASIAHEINQPLGAIVANGSAGLRWLSHATPNLDEARAALKRIVHEGHRAGQVIAGIRAMFKKEGPERVPHDVNDVVRDVLGLVHDDVERERIAVRADLVEALPHVLVDRAQLQQVILNLVTNAIDAMGSLDRRARVLRLKSERLASDGVMVTVEDTGDGIERADIDRIFEAFFTTKPHGMGMGLSISRSIVESHGGRLSASRGHPCGAVFQVVLPGHQPGTSS
jgi:PAS domain S-box-containing protein